MSSQSFRLVEQESLLRQMEQVTRTGQTVLRRLLAEMESLDFRPVASAADYAMNTIMANVDNERLSDAEFRDFVRTFLSDEPAVAPAPDADHGEAVADYSVIAVEEPKLYCTLCGGAARSLGYKQWVCNNCKQPLGIDRASTVSKTHQSI